MTEQILIESDKLFSEFKKCSQQQYNGELNIKNSQGNKWTFYYQLGQIVWATGGTHPNRRWRRNLAQNCPQIDIDQVQLTAENILIDHWDYQLLAKLYKKQQIQREQIKAIVENTIAELLFDLAQQANSTSLSCDGLCPAVREHQQEVRLEAPISSVCVSVALKQMQDSWHKWSESGLASISPDLAVVLRKPEQLQRQVSPAVYKNFEKFINGKHSLRDLAVKMKQSVLPVTRSLLPYNHKGITEFVEVSDLPLPVTKLKNNYQHTQLRTRNAPLIACVDDSPQVCKMLERIIGSKGLRFINIQDPVQALPILIQSKPDLIFLDLMMPVVNGYELCAQLRRSSVFVNTPLVILTGSDGLFDRVRSKVYGATDFITKPVETDKVMGIVNKYLQTDSTVNHTYNLALSY
ncbi:response regulator containing a CheY-like receiver domain and a GGDEF domain [Cylindrospermum stagnale PCC 7417]|uniref:Protein PatA n=1 Tax=Cylindrospermum stagnale PCC 7417 TaxID=56107 RepID=K9WTL8_9NOST|nr:response regulator [Cylindrospermum stagnale]AFZ22892.1 response regulator containing a CheY-like receiver domain and a GGDEF domain [Cylindrospermum stagnale PCC 7417]